MSAKLEESLRQAGEARSVAEDFEDSKFERGPRVLRAQPGDIFVCFLILRFINALCVRTFFQPDEYFQALEPAWSIAFGADSGAWLTWVWS